MSTIIFEGNTYTFGATVSPNPGTGTTSYVFGGLNAGQTYGFIVWAFNDVGPSSIVGPINYSTLIKNPTEQREIIGAFSWAYPNGLDDVQFNYYTGTTLNLFYDTTTLSPTWWDRPGFTRTPYVELIPGGHTGFSIDVPSGTDFLVQNVKLPLGQTFIYSWYQHTGSSLGLYFFLIDVSVRGTPTMQQLLPQIGGITTNINIRPLLGPTGGECGWIRYAVQVYTPPNASGNGFVGPFRIENSSIPRKFIIGGLQVEKSN